MTKRLFWLSFFSAVFIVPIIAIQLGAYIHDKIIAYGYYMIAIFFFIGVGFMINKLYEIFREDNRHE